MTDRAQLTASVLELIEQTFDLPQGEATLKAGPDSIAQWDSIGHLNLVLALQSRFNLRLNPIEMLNLRSAENIVDLLASRVPGGGN